MSNTTQAMERPANPPGSSSAAGLPEPVEEQQPKRSGLREAWAAWKRIARKIGDFQARVLMTIFYFVLLAPFALIVRRTSDPLAIKPGTERGWGVREGAPQYTTEMAHRQF